MKFHSKTILALALLFCLPETFAALSKEPVVITNCRSFAARADSESKTGLAARFTDTRETDCDDINKVNVNKIVSVDGIMQGKNGIFALKAFYPDGHSYDHYIMFKTFKNPERDTELWMASSSDFGRTTYAVAQSDADKTRPLGMFADAAVAPSVVPAILYSFGQDYFLDEAEEAARRNYDLGLIKIYESIVGGSEGFTSDFVMSDAWLDSENRAAALKTLRDYTIANIQNINVDNSLDPDGKLFSDYMRIYSDEFVKMTKEEAELEGKKIEIQNTFAMDDSASKLAIDAAARHAKKGAPRKIECAASACEIPEVVKRAEGACLCVANANAIDSADGTRNGNECSCECADCTPDTCDFMQKDEPQYRQRLNRIPRTRSHFVK